MHYIPGLFKSLKSKLKKVNFLLIVKSPPKLKDLVNIKLDPYSRLLCSEVYEVSFIYRDSLKRSNYIGETVRSLEIINK